MGAQTCLPMMEAAANQAPQWMEATKGHPRLLALADRHYTRQSKGFV
jgi:hypothetical protein